MLSLIPKSRNALEETSELKCPTGVSSLNLMPMPSPFARNVSYPPFFGFCTSLTPPKFKQCDSYRRLGRESTASETVDNSSSGVIWKISGGDDDKTYEDDVNSESHFDYLPFDRFLPALPPSVHPFLLPSIPLFVFTFGFSPPSSIHATPPFKLRSVYPNMWPVFELTYKLFNNDAVDFLEEMLPLFDKFISLRCRDDQKHANYEQMLLDIYVLL
ncbi:hypothetical protein GYMLUDRAFT_245306 [Collybiopsis luxurians FD-317 M1]|uniref:Uncharacterized protein n=1 Tax=Collybiopsis luxurians FD-317 M1 TaxID=944289 RepID=A0A0D0CTU5_9AGAR|nr:hypothetical protein GYMLUDRAFT_245306 [Collybiopsis luxurians FD-317 M1]